MCTGPTLSLKTCPGEEEGDAGPFAGGGPGQPVRVLRFTFHVGRPPAARADYSVYVDAERAHELLAGERARIEQALARAAHQGDGSNELDDPASLATDTYQDEYDEGLRDNLRVELAAVERAEARLEAGTYGFSVESGQPIPDERLEALPSAELTVDEEGRRR